MPAVVGAPLLSLAMFTSACGSERDDASGDIVVFAAASLTESFTEIGQVFMAEQPDSEVTFSFGASSDLVTQINEGAPADVFASADQGNMAKLTDAGNNGSEPVVFATNSLEIVVEPGNPKGIAGLADLEDRELIVVLCDPDVPIGRYSSQVFTESGVAVKADSYEEDVKAVVNKVVLGEADAGLAYSTDVVAAGDTAEGVEIPADVNVTPEYPIAVTAEAPNAGVGAAFVEFVMSDGGQAILQQHGFSRP